ncbi:hypothetical protein K1719_040706 [Acacia pycnantha]|nr:hypothetical protein K1719_040706 [Acacia pycnantha]
MKKILLRLNKEFQQLEVFTTEFTNSLHYLLRSYLYRKIQKLISRSAPEDGVIGFTNTATTISIRLRSHKIHLALQTSNKKHIEEFILGCQI